MRDRVVGEKEFGKWTENIISKRLEVASAGGGKSEQKASGRFEKRK